MYHECHKCSSKRTADEPGYAYNGGGIKTYLRQMLAKVESDIFILAKKYGVKDIFEMDSKVKNGFISENDSYEDYFALDNLEADRDKLKKLLREI